MNFELIERKSIFAVDILDFHIFVVLFMNKYAIYTYTSMSRGIYGKYGE